MKNKKRFLSYLGAVMNNVFSSAAGPFSSSNNNAAAANMPTFVVTRSEEGSKGT